jgi:hypothetical protein
MKTLAEARDEVLANLPDGSTCPCCGKHAQQYRRKFNAAMARGLAWLVQYHETKRDWVDVPNEAPRWLLRTKQLSTCAFWGLIERKPNDDPKKKHGGFWRPTPRGVLFARGRVSIPPHATTYNSKLVELSGDQIYIEDALGVDFDYAELMGARR